jgi:hypothetical protein
MADPIEIGPPRFEFEATLNDKKFGRVHMIMRDRIGIDDVTVHLIKRELFRLSGGPDPGQDVNPTFKDFLVREGFIIGG